MFTRLAALAAAAPRRLAGLGLLALIVLAIFGGPAVGKLNAPGAFNDPGSQSALAQTQIGHATGRDSYPEIVALVKAPPSSAAVAHAAAVIKADPAVASVGVSSPGARSPLVSRDGAQTLIAAVLRASVSQDDTVKRLTSDFRNDPAVLLGGDAVAGRQAGQQATRDLALAELITFPLLALLSLLIFRGVGALLPLAVGAVTVRAQPGHRPGTGPGRRLQPAVRLPVPRGTRPPGRHPGQRAGRHAEQRRAHRLVQRRHRGRGDGLPDRLPPAIPRLHGHRRRGGSAGRRRGHPAASPAAAVPP